MTDKERLADAKFKRIKEYYSAMGGLDPDIQEDVRWLINRVEELEKELNKQMNIGLKLEDEANELQKQNKRYREALSIISANLPLDGREHYVDIARQALESDNE